MTALSVSLRISRKSPDNIRDAHLSLMLSLKVSVASDRAV